MEKGKAWLLGRIPDEWFDAAAEITYDRDEIVIVGQIKDPDAGEGAAPDVVAAARAGRVRQFREDTRGKRMEIAQEAEHHFGRKVSWGVEIGENRHLFTTASIPTMTRLRMSERKVLDLLVDTGVARSRSDALAWCIRLVGKNQGEWIEQLTTALEHVERAREAGPEVA
ncbi:MAG: hypothetical protein ABIS18_11845 [Actinomycetota bacterium]